LNFLACAHVGQSEFAASLCENCGLWKLLVEGQGKLVRNSEDTED
jgi:hypothetical protein